MKKIIVLGLMASLLAPAAGFAQTTGTDGICGPNGPEAYKRPGGYCDILGAAGSLSEPGEDKQEPALVWPTPEEK